MSRFYHKGLQTCFVWLTQCLLKFCSSSQWHLKTMRFLTVILIFTFSRKIWPYWADSYMVSTGRSREAAILQVLTAHCSLHDCPTPHTAHEVRAHSLLPTHILFHVVIDSVAREEWKRHVYNYTMFEIFQTQVLCQSFFFPLKGLISFLINTQGFFYISCCSFLNFMFLLQLISLFGEGLICAEHGSDEIIQRHR